MLNDNTISHFWNTCHVARVHEVCSLDIYAKYFFRFVLTTKPPLRQTRGLLCGLWCHLVSKMDPPTYQRAIIKAFREYIDVFMKIILDDFTIFNDLSTHLEKLKKCFLKCREFNISLNLDKCAFMVFLGTILGFIVSKVGKVMDPKKVEALVNMLVATTPKEI